MNLDHQVPSSCKLLPVIGKLGALIASEQNFTGFRKRECEFHSTDWKVGHTGITGVPEIALDAQLASDEP